MLPGRVKDSTRAFGAPVDWNKERDGPCLTLHIRDDLTPAGNQMVSAWYPTAEELFRLNAGAPIHLAITGRTHPPVWRQIAMYLCREVIGKSYPALGRIFERHYTTVRDGCNRIKELMIARSDFAGEIEALKMELYSLSINKS